MARKPPAKPAAPGVASFNDKVAALDALRETRNTAQDAEVALRLQSKNDEADEVWARTSRLGVEIDVLIGGLMRDWTDSVAASTADLSTIRTEINDAVAKIKGAQQVAKSVETVLGALDQALGIAARFIL